MDELKKQIKDSFYNPILYFLPLLFFIVMDDFYGLNMAWKISFPVASLLIFYVYWFYNRLFLWHLLLSVGYILIGLIVSLIPEEPESKEIFQYSDEALFILFILILIISKSSLEKIAAKTLSYEMPMSNNVNELFRFNNNLLAIVSLYLIVIVLEAFGVFSFTREQVQNLHYAYLLAFLFLGVFETVRVFIIRYRLLHEDWLPIINDEGKVTGSSQYFHELPHKKHMHPVVRLHFIDNGILYLQQRKADDYDEASLWDAPVSRHVRLGESIYQSLKYKIQKLYNIEPLKFLFLTNYKYENSTEYQYVYLFVLCKTDGLKPNMNKIQATKWWTQNQIEDNLTTSIFTERFKIEYELLKRTGLLEQESCDCDCVLKNLINNRINRDVTRAD